MTSVRALLLFTLLASQAGTTPVLARQNSALESLADLAAGPDFYLVLDPHGRHLRLMLGGAELRRYAVLDVRVGRPRVAFVPRSATMTDGVLRGGALRPARHARRVSITPPTAADVELNVEAEAVPPLPPTPEEAYPAPWRYLVRFDSGSTLELRGPDAEGARGALTRLASRWSTYWSDLWAAVTSRGDGTRFQVTLSADDAGALYRALPPNVGLVVCPLEMSPCHELARPVS